MKRLKLLIASMGIAVLGVTTILPAATTFAIDPLAICNDGANADNAVCQNKDENATTLIGTLVNTLLFVVGLIAVVMVIFAGIQYTTSSGDAGKVAKAKNTLTYAIVGLIVAFIAFALVNWVFQLF